MDQQGMPGPMTQASRLKKDSGLVQPRIRAALVKIVELAGIKILNLLYTANTNARIQTSKVLWRDAPAREKISERREAQAASVKHQAASFKRQASSTKRFKDLGARFITRATSLKHQATSNKLSYVLTLIKFWDHGTGIKNWNVVEYLDREE